MSRGPPGQQEGGRSCAVVVGVLDFERPAITFSIRQAGNTWERRESAWIRDQLAPHEVALRSTPPTVHWLVADIRGQIPASGESQPLHGRLAYEKGCRRQRSAPPIAHSSHYHVARPGTAAASRLEPPGSTSREVSRLNATSRASGGFSHGAP